MPALPALLLSVHFLSFLLVTMAPRSLSQAPLLSSVRMGKWPLTFIHNCIWSGEFYKCRLKQAESNSFLCCSGLNSPHYHFSVKQRNSGT